MKSKGKVKLCWPTRKSKPPLEMRLRSCELPAPEPQRSSSLVIDLTMVTDDEETVPSNATRNSQPNFKRLALSQNWLPSVGAFLWSRLCKPPSSCSLIYMLVTYFQSQPDVTAQSDQSSYKHTIFHRPPQQGFTASLALSHTSLESPSSPASSPIATTSGRVASDNFEFFRRPGLLLPLLQSDIPSGTCGNPIVIEDSETEN